MVCSAFMAALVDRLRRRPALPPSRSVTLAGISWPELADASLKPGQKTWLVARAVSLRAF
jgi:hypothetical protein